MPDTGFLNNENAPEGLSQVEVQISAPAAEVMEASVQAVESEAGDISSVVADEQAMEAMAENPDTFLEQSEASSPSADEAGMQQVASDDSSTTVTDAQGSVLSVPRDEVVLEVEKILEDGLGDYYQHMPEEAKTRFHAKGQEIAVQLAGMVRTLRVQVKKALELIKRWLKTIPGVNKFFLEQESKIKTDRIVALQVSLAV